MSFFSSIGNGIRSLASGVYNTVNSIGSGIASTYNSIRNTINSSSGNTSAAINAGGTRTNPSPISNAPGTIVPQVYPGSSGSGSGQNVSTGNYNYTPTSYSAGASPFITTGNSNYPTVGGGTNGEPAQLAPVSKTVLATDLKSGTQTANALGSVSSSGNGNGAGAGSSPGTPYGNNVALGGTQNGFPNGTTLDKTGNTVKIETNANQDAQANTDANKVKTMQDYMKEVMGMQPETPNADALRQQANNEAGINAARLQMQNTQNQINGITAKLNTDLLGQRQMASDNGGTEFAFGGRQAAITREATIKLLPLQAQLASDQGNVELAKSTADELFKYRYQDATAKADRFKEAYSMAKDLFTYDEKKRVDAIKQTHDDNASTLTRQYNSWNELYKQALDSGQGSLATKILNTMNRPVNTNSTNFNNDLSLIGNEVVRLGAGVINTQSQINRVHLQNAILQGQKLQNEVNSSKPASGEYANVINAVSGLVGATKAPAVKNAIATSLANGDPTTAYANIANAVEDSLTGTNKTKFADTRTDIGVMGGMREAINAYTQAGGNLGYLKGTADTIAKKFGQLAVDPKFAALGVQLQREFQAYRLAMTGAAFSPAESKEYAAVNPRTNASLDLNLATIDGALAQLTNRVTSTINQRIPEAQKIYDLANGKSSNTPVTPEIQSLRSKYNY